MSLLGLPSSLRCAIVWKIDFHGVQPGVKHFGAEECWQVFD